MGSYNLCDHIYASQFRNELILLDTKRDKYKIFPQQFLELVGEASSGGFSCLPSYKPNPYNKIDIEELINAGIIEEKMTSYPYYIDQKIDSDGVSNVDWRLPLESKKVNLNMQVLDALMKLIKVNFYMQIKGFYRTIQLIKNSRRIESNYTIPQPEELEYLASIINKACFIYPTRTKCLEWAMTFVLLALKRKWKCNLEIGVQNYPFMAHAWVECEGKVVMDSQDLREKLAIILNEPFRRLKT